VSTADSPDWSEPILTAQYATLYQGFGSTPAVETIIFDETFGETVYLFGFDIALEAGGTPGVWFLEDDDAEKMIACGYCPAGGSDHVDLNGVVLIGTTLRLQHSDANQHYAVRWTTST
jgi:hypothetical protein